MKSPVSCLGILAALIPLGVSFAESDRPGAGDESVVRELVAKLAHAHEMRDADSAISFWDRSSPQFAEGSAAFRRTLSSYQELKLTKIEIRRLALSGSKASVELTLEAQVVRAGKQGQPPAAERLNRTLELTRSGTDWKLSRYVFTETLFADELLAAKTPDERQHKLTSQPHLVDIQLVRSLIRRGYELSDRAKHAEATDAHVFARELAERIQYKDGVVEAYRGMGGVHYAKREYREALELFQQSLKLARDTDYKLGITKALSSVGNVQFRQGNLSQALQSQQEALKIAEALNDSESTTGALYGIAQVYQQQAKFEQALEIQNRIIELCNQRGDQTCVAGAFGNMANIYSQQSNYKKALEYFTKTLEMAEKLKVRVWIPLALNNIGTVHMAQGNYLLALQRFHQSVEVANEIGSKNSAADGLMNIGNVYSLQGDDEQALSFYQKSLALCEQMGATAPMATILLSMGSVHARRGEHAKALELFSKSLEVNERMGNRLSVAAVSVNIGNVYMRQGKHDQAEKYYKSASDIWGQLQNRAGIATALKSFGQLYYVQGDFKRAIESSTRAASIAEELALAEVVVEARLTLGDSHQALGELDHAERAYADSIAAIEKVRERIVGGAQERELFREKLMAPYHRMIALLVERGDGARALEFAERVKGRVLLDALRDGRDVISKAMTASEQREEEKLVGQIHSLNSQLAKESSRKQPDDAVAALRDQLQRARLDYESFETRLYATHPELRTQRGEVSAPTLETLTSLLQGRRRAIVEFAVGSKRSFLFVITAPQDTARPAQLDVFPLSVSSEKLSKLVDDFRMELLGRTGEFPRQSRMAFQELFAPAAGRLKGITELCIVPDGPLWELPFEALLVRKDRYLVEDLAIFYSPSLAVLREMVNARQKMQSAEDATARLLAVGNPVVSPAMVQRIQIAHRDEALVPLPEAEREVEALRQLYGQSRSAIYTRTDAREEQVKSEAGKYRVVHFATHGRLDDRSPLYSHLVLAPPEDGSKEDGLLEAWEVMKMDLRAELAVLSACETARGRIGAGEGVIGMSWAFFVAGVPTTVVSHWKVDSSSTTELMVAFHRNLTAVAGKSGGISKAEALRRAELQLLKKRRFRHPYYWASFAVVGNGM